MATKGRPAGYKVSDETKAKIKATRLARKAEKEQTKKIAENYSVYISGQMVSTIQKDGSREVEQNVQEK